MRISKFLFGALLSCVISGCYSIPNHGFTNYAQNAPYDPADDVSFIDPTYRFDVELCTPRKGVSGLKYRNMCLFLVDDVPINVEKVTDLKNPNSQVTLTRLAVTDVKSVEVVPNDDGSWLLILMPLPENGQTPMVMACYKVYPTRSGFIAKKYSNSAEK